MENQRKQCKGANRELGCSQPAPFNDIVMIKIHAAFLSATGLAMDKLVGLSESLERENSGTILKTIPLLRVSFSVAVVVCFSKEDAALSKTRLSFSVNVPSYM